MSADEYERRLVPRILEDGKTPSQWVRAFADRGIVVSEPALREKARAIGASCMLGNAMVMLPEHIDLIFEPPRAKGAPAPSPVQIPAGDYQTLLELRARQKRAKKTAI